MSEHPHNLPSVPSDESIIDLDLDDLDVMEDRWEEVGPTVYDALFIETRPDNNAPVHDGELDEAVMTRLHETLSAVPMASLEQRIEDADKSLIEDLALIDSILQTGLRALDQQDQDIDATLAREIKLAPRVNNIEISSSLLMTGVFDLDTGHTQITPSWLDEEDAEPLDEEDIEEVLDPLVSPELDYRRTIAERSMELDVDELLCAETTDAELSPASEPRADATMSLEDLGILDSGIFEVEEISRALRIPRNAPPRTPQATPQQAVAPAHQAAHKRQVLIRAGLDAAGRMEVREPWLSWVSQARQEIMGGNPHSAEEIGALAALARISTGASHPILTALELLASELGPPRRDLALYQLAQRWQAGREEVARTLDALAQLDDSLATPQAPQRHAAIALARLTEDLLRAAPGEHDPLVAWLTRTPSASAHAVRALIAHRHADRSAAAAAWRAALPYVHPNDRDALTTHAAALEASAPEQDMTPRHVVIDGMALGQLRHAAHLLAWRGDRVHEALALQALARRDYDEHDPALLAALLTRQAWLSRAWTHTSTPDERLAEQPPLKLRAEAANRAARSLLHARLWEVEARAVGKLDDIQAALERQLELVREPAHRALLWEQLACAKQAAGVPPQLVRACLDRALRDAPDSLPALLGLGHIATLEQDWRALLELRTNPSVHESGELDPAWRRAELLWRTGGDPREILSMIRTARLARPDDPHLYLMMLRGLASQRQWRGIVTLTESCRQDSPALAQRLRNGDLDPAHTQLAVDLYLEDSAPTTAPAQLAQTWAERASRPAPSLVAEEGLLWRITAQDVAEREPLRALSRLEGLDTTGAGQAATTRLRLWRLYLTGWQLRQPERGRDDWRALCAEASTTLLRRFAIHGALRNGDAAWLAHNLPDAALIELLEIAGLSHHAATGRVGLLRAELFAHAGCPEDACETLITEAERSGDAGIAYHARERAVGVALQAKLWDELALLLSVALTPADRSARAALLIQLAACADQPHTPDELGVQPLWTDPLTALAGLEGALRRQDRAQTLAICDAALTTPRRRPQHQNMLHMLALICAEGHTSDEDITRRLRLWESVLEPEDASLAAWLYHTARLRIARRAGDNADAEQTSQTLLARFGDEAAEAARTCHVPPARLLAWAEAEAAGAMGKVRALLMAEAALRRWVMGERGRLDAQTLSDQAALGTDTSGLIDFLACLALRQQGQHASMERQLQSLASKTHLPVASLWARVRAMLHLATSQNCEEDALALCDDPALVVDVPWLSSWRALLARSLGHGPIEPLTSAQEGARLACALESAAKDPAQSLALAQQGIPGAILMLEVKAAVERRDWRAEHGLELAYTAARTALVQAPQQEALARFMRYTGRIEAALLGSPWCPMRLAANELTRLGLGVRELEMLSAQARTMEGAGPLAEWQLVLARQAIRLGQRGVVEALLPQIRHDLVTRAWALLLLSYDPTGASQAIQTWQAARWARLAERAGQLGEQDDLLAAALTWELGRTLEACGRPDDAIRAWRHALVRSPGFGPALAMLGRALIMAQDWSGLAALWEQTLAETSAEAPRERLGLHLRLGWIYERTLADGRPTLERALWHHQQALRIDPEQPAALHAAWRLAHRLGEHEALAVALGQLIEATQDRDLKVAALVELGQVEEHLLGDRDRALHAYQAAWELDAAHLDALWGMLQLEPWGSESLVRAVEATLEHKPLAPTREALGDWLCLVAPQQPRAAYMLEQRFADHLVWRLQQLGRGLERGELDEDALAAIREQLADEQIRTLCALLELQHTSPRPGADEQERLARQVEQVGLQPWSEGLLVAGLARAGASRELDALAGLHGALAARAPTPLEEGLAWLHVIIARAWAGHIPTALQLVEKLLERLPDFLPAVRLAAMLAEQQGQWASMARWCQREAELTCGEARASACRVKASEVQRRYLGDLAAASDQLRLVLQQDPTHAEAFERLRQLLIQRGEVRQLIQISERWIPRITSRERRIEILNELADLSLNHLQDNACAIRFLSMSLQEEPRQLRRLRVLGELQEQQGEFVQAVTCYEAAVALASDARLGARLHLQLGQLYEERLKQHERAAAHYKEALKRGPEAPLQALRALVRVQEATRDFVGALESLDRLEALVRSPDELKQVRMARLEVAQRASLPAESLIAQAKLVLRHYPEHQGAADIVRAKTQGIDPQGALEATVRELLREITAESSHPALGGYFTLARRWRLDDLSYCMAAVARWQGTATREMTAYHDMCAIERRWPRRPIPVELTMGVLPSTLSAPFFEVIRRSQEGLAAATDALPYAAFLKRRSRMSGPTSEAQQLAWRWPELFGLTIRDVHMAEQRLPVGAAAFWDDGLRLVLDPQWERPALPELTALLARLGPQLAGISMGIGAWAMFGREAQMFLLSYIAGHIVSGWRKGHDAAPRLPAWFKLERFERWMARGGRDALAPYVLELTGRLGHAAMPPQFMQLELAMERLGCVVLPDPYRFLPHTARLGAALGATPHPWTFLFEPQYGRLRESLGIAVGAQ